MSSLSHTVVPVLFGGGEPVGLAVVHADGKIEIQINNERAMGFLFGPLIDGLGDALVVDTRLIQHRTEKQDGTS